MNDCVFCNILSGNLPAHFVCEDDLVVAFLSLEQPNPYKVLVVPRAHVAMVYDLNDEQAAAIFQATVKIARGVRSASHCDGMNLVQSNGRAGQQDVFHFHLHIVPRFLTDDIVLDWDNTPTPQDSMRQICREISEALDETKLG
jgi:histidine triad (HIT) family protein